VGRYIETGVWAHKDHLMAMVRGMWRVPVDIKPWWPGVRREADAWTMERAGLVGMKLMMALHRAGGCRPK
jgi:hypothetical protein